MAGDEFYDDDVTSGPIFDVLGFMDDERKRLRESFACMTCGSPDPAIIFSSPPSCSDCERRCHVHQRALPCCEVIVEQTDGYIVVAEVAS